MTAEKCQGRNSRLAADDIDAVELSFAPADNDGPNAVTARIFELA